MNIQEFSHQLGQEEHPSRLLRALRELRGLEVERLRRARRPEWGVWNDQKPRVQASET
jgi:hypothetical protein